MWKRQVKNKDHNDGSKRVGQPAQGSTHPSAEETSRNAWLRADQSLTKRAMVEPSLPWPVEDTADLAPEVGKKGVPTPW